MAERYIEYMPLPELLRAERNPKAHDAALIASSLRRFGLVESIALDDRTGRLVAGHGRLDQFEAARAAEQDPPDGVTVREDGEWLVPVQRGWASADDAEAEAYVVTSNQAVIAGGWHRQELADVLADLRAGPGLDAVGFTPGQLDAMLADLNPTPPEEFPSLGDGQGLATDHRCPKCGYEWSGKQAP